jgi:hypothetical protein
MSPLALVVLGGLKIAAKRTDAGWDDRNVILLIVLVRPVAGRLVGSSTVSAANELQLLRFDHAIVGKKSEPCLTISFYLDGYNMTYLNSRSAPPNHDITGCKDWSFPAP